MCITVLGKQPSEALLRLSLRSNPDVCMYTSENRFALLESLTTFELLMFEECYIFLGFLQKVEAQAVKFTGLQSNVCRFCDFYHASHFILCHANPRQSKL